MSDTQWPEHTTGSEPLKEVRAEIDLLRQKAEAFDWLVKDERICNWIFGCSLSGEWFITEPHVKIHASKCKTLLESINQARKEIK
jgi:hypothetical protein